MKYKLSFFSQWCAYEIIPSRKAVKKFFFFVVEFMLANELGAQHISMSSAHGANRTL